MKQLWLMIVLTCVATCTASAGNISVLPDATAAATTDLHGTIIDAKTKQPLPYAVVQVSWFLRAEGTKNRKDAQTDRRLWVRQIVSGAGGRFDIPTLKQLANVPGWNLLPGQDPVVRIYAKGYERLVIENTVKSKSGRRVPVNAPGAAQRKWVGEGTTQALRHLPDVEAAVAKELALWKKELENEIALSPARDRESAIRSQEKLLALFEDWCNTLSAPRRGGLCYGADSELGQYLAQAKAERTNYLVVEEPDGQIKKYPLQFHPAPAPQVAPQQIGPPPSPNAAATQGVSGTSRAPPPLPE